MDHPVMEDAVMEDGVEAALYNYFCLCPRVSARAVRTLLKMGADVNYTGPLDKTPLHAYLHTGGPKDVRIVQALLKAGAYVDVYERCCSSTPLHLYLRLAVVDLRVLKTLMRGRCQTIDILLSSRFMSSLLREYVLNRDFSACSWEVMEFLVRAGANVNDGIGFTRTLLHACMGVRTNVFMVNSILKLGADVRARDVYGATPLGALLKSPSACVELVELLVAAGSDVCTVDARHNNLLHQHAQSRRPSAAVIRRLIELGCDPTALNSSGNTPLHLMAAHTSCKRSLIQPFLDAGVAVDVRNARYDTTPLHVAAAHRNDKACARLLALGADVTLRSFTGKTPLAHMIVNDHITCIDRALDARPAAVAVAESLAVAEVRGVRASRRCVAYVVAHIGAHALPEPVRQSQAAFVAECEAETALMRAVRVGTPATPLLDVVCSRTPPATLVRRRSAKSLKILSIYRDVLQQRLVHMRHRSALVDSLVMRIGPCPLPADVVALVLLRVPTPQLRTSCGLDDSFCMN
ncbi:ORF004 ankyrin repeat protein [Bovine papular stomatitis virus]|uniref:ORF004 ankyrin repeat protein n=1 Tax=Bovine papular stomatitis virus TaxID=129727 RepID=Q6TVI4_9POXV|nr:ankyrin-like protein [Bovine papular stomatitis virus]AAR98361.1 ORF004 ankyrin repeat protein [Bovine papular stomatitis virus]